MADRYGAARIALVLGGGNALGAYHAGVYQALHERGVEPDWIVGASVGAVCGAIVAGNAPDHRLDRLRALWRPAEDGGAGDWLPETMRRSAAVLWTLAAGRGGMFGPIGSHHHGWRPSDATPALFDTGPMLATLPALVDFDRLQSGAPRFTALAVDLESGDEVLFDTCHRRVEPEHIRASAALLTAYPGVEVDGRVLVDGGVSANLPLDPVLGADDGVPTLCIAADLLPLARPRPRTFGEVVERMQDLTFAAQSRRSIERWRTRQDSGSMTLVRLAYADQGREVAGKALDFSPASVRHRWDAGRRDADAMLDRLDRGEIVAGRPGFADHAG